MSVCIADLFLLVLTGFFQVSMCGQPPRIMPLCCVHSCLFPGKRFVRFPLKDVALFRQWLERINNPQLFRISPKNVYTCHKVCERHFLKEQLCEVAYPGSNQRAVVPGACPSLFLNEEIVCKRDDIRHIRWDHTYSRIEVNAQNDPTTVAAEICELAERDNDPGVVATTSSAPSAYQQPSKERERIFGPLQQTTLCFLNRQLREHRNNKLGRRFTLDEKKIALSLLARKRGAYKLMRNYFTMPSVTTLQRMLARTSLQPDGREIVHLYDPAHLLRGFRNNLLTKDLDFELDNTQYRASWQDIVALYDYDCTGTVARCPSLNDFNVLPQKIRKMSVKNSAQVFTRSVYAGLQNLLDERSPDLHGLPQSASAYKSNVQEQLSTMDKV
ncbi:hypothetical protein CBL_05685 [Carabus blaptoides fortunei]